MTCGIRPSGRSLAMKRSSSQSSLSLPGLHSPSSATRSGEKQGRLFIPMRMQEVDGTPNEAVWHEVWHAGALASMMQGRGAEKACIEVTSWCWDETNAAAIPSTSIMIGQAESHRPSWQRDTRFGSWSCGMMHEEGICGKHMHFSVGSEGERSALAQAKGSNFTACLEESKGSWYTRYTKMLLNDSLITILSTQQL